LLLASPLRLAELTRNDAQAMSQMRPGNRYDWGKTLGDLIRAKLVLLQASELDLSAVSLIERFGQDCPAIATSALTCAAPPAATAMPTCTRRD
jgi:hypothetical protein